MMSKETPYKSKYLYVMVDLETTRANVNADILSIGAYVYDPETKDESTYINFANYDSLTFNSSTLRFWVNHNDTFVKLLDDCDNSKLNEKELLIEFNEYLRYITKLGHEVLIFGNGATFDNALLRKKMSDYDIDYVVKYKNDLDYRTIEFVHSLLGYSYIPSPVRGTEHDALEDARYQMNTMIEIFKLWERLI